MRVRVKICGITNVEDALAAAHCGADAIGLVFAESPRRIDPKTARSIVESLPPFVCPVGVFVDEHLEVVLETARIVGLHSVQLSGSEAPEYVERLSSVDVIKCIRVRKACDVERAADYPDAKILLDTASERVAGGTGETFPWEYAVGLAAGREIILAGGLKPENVGEVIRMVGPWGVDVSSGVEASPGSKDEAKIRRFMESVRRPGNAKVEDQGTRGRDGAGSGRWQ